MKITESPKMRRYGAIIGIVAVLIVILVYRYGFTSEPKPTKHFDVPKGHIKAAQKDQTGMEPGGRGSPSAWSFEPTNKVPSPHINNIIPFRNPSLSWEERVDDLVRRLTIEEIIPQTQAIYRRPTPAIERLGIKPYTWITECLHGQHGSKGTAFPVPIGMAASFSSDLLHNISEAISYEVRAHWNDMTKKGRYKTMFGLTCFSPTINILRHPFWGRNQETYGEDPHLTGVMAASYVHGLQGNHDRYVRAAAGCKHFAAHGGPDQVPVSRYSFDAKVSEADLRMTYLPHFKKCIEAGSLGLMCSYNRINGIPACANHKLLTKIAREHWNFQGYVVSDAGAIVNIMTQHKYRDNAIDTVSAAIKAGCNLELTGIGTTLYEHQSGAVRKGSLTEDDIRHNAKPLFYTRMRLGEFDPPGMNPYNKIDMSVVQSEDHRELAIKAAMMSFVLLKNQERTLPLKKTPYKRVAIFGPYANNIKVMYGGYAPDINVKYVQSVAKVLSKLGQSYIYEPGCTSVRCLDYQEEKVKEAVKGADLIVATLGTEDKGEFSDRRDLSPSGYHRQMIEDIAMWGAKIPIILLLFNGAAMDITWAESDDRIGAILECFLPGQGTAQAIYRTLTMTGPQSVPAGRLPYTWPKTAEQIPPITHYYMNGHTYRYYEGDPQYPFGYGLSYTRFMFSELKINPSKVMAGANVKVTVKVQNVALYNADEVVQVYIAWNNVSVPSLPRLQLVGFRRLGIAIQKQVLCEFTITAEQMMVWADNHVGFKVLPGTVTVYVGGQQPNQKKIVPSNVLTGYFHVEPGSDAYIPKDEGVPDADVPSSRDRQH